MLKRLIQRERGIDISSMSVKKNVAAAYEDSWIGYDEEDDEKDVEE